MNELEKHIDLLERLLNYMIQGYRPFDAELAIKTILRTIIVIGKHVLSKDKNESR